MKIIHGWIAIDCGFLNFPFHKKKQHQCLMIIFDIYNIYSPFIRSSNGFLLNNENIDFYFVFKKIYWFSQLWFLSGKKTEIKKNSIVNSDTNDGGFTNGLLGLCKPYPISVQIY